MEKATATDSGDWYEGNICSRMLCVLTPDSGDLVRALVNGELGE
jgi:hypothetical protein